MKTYTITVNGKAYAVTVEEGAAAPAALQPHRLPQPRTCTGTSSRCRTGTSSCCTCRRSRLR